uniref:Uncharacterized protein n=1 Tax=Arundo donax TaxID=35708 RepID=A0A0A9C9C7_ARUDO
MRPYHVLSFLFCFQRISPCFAEPKEQNS